MSFLLILSINNPFCFHVQRKTMLKGKVAKKRLLSLKRLFYRLRYVISNTVLFVPCGTFLYPKYIISVLGDIEISILHPLQ